MTTVGNGPHEAAAALVRRHLVAGWSWIVVFLVLGTVLEVFHGFKIGWYVSVANATRRLMWTLAHAHGTLLGLVNLGFAATVAVRSLPARRSQAASLCLLGASVLLPTGFFLGGLVIYGGDPGLGILLTPVGALLLATAGVLTVSAVRASAPDAPLATSRGTPVASGSRPADARPHGRKE